MARERVRCARAPPQHMPRLSPRLVSQATSDGAHLVSSRFLLTFGAAASTTPATLAHDLEAADKRAQSVLETQLRELGVTTEPMVAAHLPSAPMGPVSARFFAFCPAASTTAMLRRADAVVEEAVALELGTLVSHLADERARAPRSASAVSAKEAAADAGASGGASFAETALAERKARAALMEELIEERNAALLAAWKERLPRDLRALAAFAIDGAVAGAPNAHFALPLPTTAVFVNGVRTGALKNLSHVELLDGYDVSAVAREVLGPSATVQWRTTGEGGAPVAYVYLPL
jgi:hypothetical protein